MKRFIPFSGYSIAFSKILKYSGSKLYVVIGLLFISATLEGLGIAMLIPLIQKNGSTVSSDSSAIRFLDGIGVFSLPLGYLLLIIGGLFVFKGIFRFVSGIVNALISNNLNQSMKYELLRKYGVMNYEFYLSKDSGHFTNVINLQVNKSVLFFNEFSKFNVSIATSLVYVLLAFFIEWRFSLMAIISGLIIVILMRKLTTLTKNLSVQVNQGSTELNKSFIQILQGYKYLKATNAYRILRQQSEDLIRKINQKILKTNYLSSFSTSISEPLIVIIVLIIIFLFSTYVSGDLTPIIITLVLFYRTMTYLLQAQNNWQNTMAFASSLDIVDHEINDLNAHVEPEGDLEISDFKEAIVFQNVSLTIGTTKILKGIDLIFPKNKTIAIVGPSGAGKSTILDLITVLYQPTQGDILIDGISSKKILKNQWRNLIGFSTQDFFILNEDVKTNMIFGDTINHEKMLESAEMAHCTEFIEAMEYGYDTQIGERGIRISGGQKQRLSIAREIYKKPQLLLLDEATSALDSESEQYIQDSLEKLKGKLTMVIVAHRLSTIKHADIIYVLMDGKVVGKGDFEELSSEQESWFNKIVKMQGMQSNDAI
jgi:ABC-type multidrug transport system fused ATPase/permease subunit